jgi:uncharacterized protein DUF2721
MDTGSMVQSPFAALTFVAAPALLTNASSVLALSTINRMLRTRDRMHDLFAKSETGKASEQEALRLIEQVDRVERQAALLLRALRSIYVALAAFASATLVTLLGAGMASFQGALWLHVLAGIGVALGLVGVGGLVFGCVSLFHATQLSLLNIRDEAAAVRERQATRKPLAGGGGAARG